MVDDLVAELHRRGVRLRLTDGRLDVLAPPSALTDELRERLRHERDDLVALLGRSAVGAPAPVPVPRPQDRYAPFPLTDIQHAYWVGRTSAVELGGVATHFYVELERSGLQVSRLEAALRRVIERHDMLRAVVRPDGTQQVLAQVPPYEIPLTDLAGLPAAEQDAGIERVRAELAHRVPPADRWPLLAVRATRRDGDLLRLHVSIDLLIADAASVAVLFADWQRCYEDPEWSPEPIGASFRDHVLAEEAQRDGARHAAARSYWLDRLDSLPGPPDLPLAVRPGQVGVPRFTRRRTALDPARWTALREQAHRRGTTPSVVLATAYADVLRTWSGQSRFTLNLSLFNRPPGPPGIAEVVGDFTSVTLLEVDATPDVPFGARAERLQRQLLRDLEHVSFSGVRVQRERSRRLGDGPAAGMPVVFTSALAHTPGLGSSGAFFGGSGFFGSFRHGISQTPQVWIDHQVAEEQGTLYTNWDAVEELFPAGVLDAMFAAYRGLLDELATDPAAWDRRTTVLPPPDQLEERRQTDRTDGTAPAGTLTGPVLRQAADRPDAPAVVDADGTWTYRELVAEASRVAAALRPLGVGTGSVVAVVLPRGRDQVATTLGVLLAGAAYLPIDPDWPPARRSQLLAQAGVAVAVTSRDLPDPAAWPDGVRRVTAADLPARDPGAPDAEAPVPGAPAPEDLAYVIFTSGSTGRPKGVMIDHRSAANTLQDVNARFGVGPHDRVLALSAASFDLSVWDVFGVLAAGGTVVVPHPGRAHDPAHWTDLVRRHGVTLWNSVPALMQAWLDDDAAGPDPSVRLVLLSGDWIGVDLPDAVRRRCPGAEVISLGGATEASVWSVFHPIGTVAPGQVRIPYGRPLAHQTLHVLDDALEPCPVWTTGELYIGGAGLALGYRDDPERTAERFVVHPGTGERLYRTGDHARYLPGGDVDFLGRTDDQVKINGHRIELGEVAAALRRQPGVRDALAVVDTNPVTGRRQLVGYVVPGPSGPEPDGDAAAAPGGRAGAAPPDHAAALLAAGRDRRRAAVAADPDGVASHRSLVTAFNDLTVPLVARTLARLGTFRTAGERAHAEGIVTRSGVRPRYRGLVARWLELLAAAGRLVATGTAGEYRADRPLDAAALDAEVGRRLAALPTGGTDGVLGEYVTACAAHQVELLRGEATVLEYLVPDGSDRVTRAMYATNPLSVVQNAVVARLVGAFADGRPDAGPVRVLEVGAGVGATTEQVLAELPPDRTAYRFTDVSTFFTERARARFADRPGLTYGLFDIDRPPADQGLEPGSVDVVIGANVVHNARDLAVTLRALRSVLAPGGLLVLVENTVNEPFHAVTVGFYQDFGGYADGRGLPLLTPARWQELLLEAGFDAVGALPDDGADPVGQHVLTATRAPAAVPAVAGDGEGLDPAQVRRGVAELLPGYLVPQHCVAVDRFPLSANGKVDVRALPRPWEAATAPPVDPHGELEHRIREIWREALARDDFGVRDNFFELGGDSLHAVRIIGRLREELGLRVTADEGLQLLFDHPTVAEQAAALDAVRAS